MNMESFRNDGSERRRPLFLNTLNNECAFFFWFFVLVFCCFLVVIGLYLGGTLARWMEIGYLTNVMLITHRFFDLFHYQRWLCCCCCCYVFYGSFLFWRRRVARSSHGIIFCCPMYYKRVVYWYLYLGSVAIDGSSIVLRAALEPTLTFLTWKFSVEMRLKWSPSIFLRSNAKFDAVAQD